VAGGAFYDKSFRSGLLLLKRHVRVSNPRIQERGSSSCTPHARPSAEQMQARASKQALRCTKSFEFSKSDGETVSVTCIEVGFVMRPR
jgi:hypothetical protein